MSVDLLVLIYLYVCCSMLLFDIIYILHMRYERWRAPRRVRQMRDRILWQLVTLRSHGTVDRTGMEQLVRLLRRPSNLQAFIEALSGLCRDGVFEITKFITSMPVVMLRLVPVYRRKRSEYRAYLSYGIAGLRMGGDYHKRPDSYRQKCSRLSGLLLPMLEGRTMFERGNACKAILSLGDIKIVLEMMRRIARNENSINSKLLVEYLLGSVLEAEEMSVMLTNHMDSFDPWIQVAIIDYIRMLPRCKELQQTFCPMLFDRLCRGKTDKEVRLAIIRYFRRSPYKPAYKELLEIAEGENDKNWEYSAVAASSLASYPGQQTVDTLKRALCSRNWYVRFNAAESLIALGVSQSELSEDADRFAQGMLSYRDEISKLKEGGRAQL